MELALASMIASDSEIDTKQPASQEEVWLSVKEAAELLNISWKQARLYCRTGKFSALQQIVANGGRQYRIGLSCLPTDARSAYFAKHLPQEAAEEEKILDSQIYSKAPSFAQRKADKYLTILRECDGILGRAELEKWIQTWNERNPDMQTSYPSICRARAKMQDEGVAGLLAKYGNRGGETTVEDHHGEYFKALYLQMGAPSLQSCWYRVVGLAKSITPDLDIDSFPKPDAFKRWIDNRVPQASQFLARYGQAAFDRKYGSCVDRDYSNVRAGQVWVSDHHQLDVAVVDKRTGKPCFPWLTVWRDFKTGKWLGWFLHCESPNSDHIFMSFFIAAKLWGLPDDILIDNGKDYRCRDFAGGRVSRVRVSIDETACRKQLSTMDLLKIKVHFALPYNAKAKPIERDFRSLIELLCRHLVGYRGSNITERPEKLVDEIKTGKIIDFDLFMNLFDEFVINSFNRRTSLGKNLLGKSPDAAFSEEFTEKKPISLDSLMLFCMRTSDSRQIGKNGFHDTKYGIDYWGDWMSPMKGRSVYLRQDVKDYANAWVFDAQTDEWLGMARARVYRAPAMAETPVEKAQLDAALSACRRDKKIAKAYINGLNAPGIVEQLHNLQEGIQAVSGPVADPNPQIHRMPDTMMDAVVREKKMREREHSSDVSDFAPPMIPEKKELFLFECDHESAAQAALG